VQHCDDPVAVVGAGGRRYRRARLVRLRHRAPASGPARSRRSGERHRLLV